MSSNNSSTEEDEDGFENVASGDNNSGTASAEDEEGVQHSRYRSKIHEHTEMVENGAFFVCNYCDKRYSRKQSNTSTVRRHLIQQHAIEGLERNRPEQQNEVQEDQKMMDPHSKEYKAITEEIRKALILDLESWRKVERKGFAGLIKFFKPTYKMPHRTSFARQVPDLYEEVKRKVAQKITEDLRKG